jgi:hypothetical protein
MEKEAKKSNFYENMLFGFLGAVSAIVISLGTFGAVDNRAPASIEAPITQTDFDPRVFMGE